MMTILDAIRVVLKCTTDLTNSTGAPQDGPFVGRVLDGSATIIDYNYVAGLAFANFFANSSSAFDNVKAQLWDCMNPGNCNMPDGWTFMTLLGSVAINIHVCANPDPVADAQAGGQ